MKLQDATNIYIGTASATAVYLGTNQIWSSSNDPQEQQVQHEFLSPTSGSMIEGVYASDSTEGYMELLSVGSAADNYSTNVLIGTNFFDLITITDDTGGCVQLVVMDDVPYILIGAGQGTCTLTYNDGTNTCSCTFDYSITDVASQSSDDMYSFAVEDIANANGISSGTQLGYTEEWNFDNLLIRNMCAEGNGLSYNSANDGHFRMYVNTNGYIEFEYGGNTISKIVLHCISSNYVGGQLETPSGIITVDYNMVIWEGAETIVQIQNLSSPQIRFSSIDIYVVSQSAGDMTSVQITDMASDNGLSSGQTMQYEEEWHGDSQRFIICNKSTAGTGVAYYHTTIGDQLRIYGSATVEFEYDTHTITKIVLHCVSANYVGNIGTLTTPSGSVTQDDVNYTVTWEGSATTVQIQNNGSRQIRLTSIDIYYV